MGTNSNTANQGSETKSAPFKKQVNALQVKDNYLKRLLEALHHFGAFLSALIFSTSSLVFCKNPKMSSNLGSF